MSLSMYQASVPVFIKMLGNLAEILKKGESYATAKKIDQSVLVGARLAPDMFPLSKQIAIACDSAKLCTARLSGTEAPVYEDTETTFTDLQARIENTVKFLKSVKAEQVDGTEDKTISFKAGQKDVTLKGTDYLFQRAFPNHFFHITTAYDILRHNGVEIGKGDYLGQ